MLAADVGSSLQEAKQLQLQTDTLLFVLAECSPAHTVYSSSCTETENEVPLLVHVVDPGRTIWLSHGDGDLTLVTARVPRCVQHRDVQRRLGSETHRFSGLEQHVERAVLGSLLVSVDLNSVFQAFLWQRLSYKIGGTLKPSVTSDSLERGCTL